MIGRQITGTHFDEERAGVVVYKASMLHLHQIQFAFGDNLILDNVDLSLGVGECVAIVGPNGAGKSTLLRLVAGLLEASSGDISVLGNNPYRANRQRQARRLAYLSQHYRMAFPFTAIEVVLMGRYAHSSRGFPGRDRSPDRELALAALKRCNVEEFADREIDKLSGGEQRRVLIAQALCQGSELLLLDEPTAGLDPSHAQDLFRLVAQECESERSCLLVTHDLNLASRFCTKILLIDSGRRLILDTPAVVLDSDELRDSFSVNLHRGELPDNQGPYVVPY